MPRFTMKVAVPVTLFDLYEIGIEADCAADAKDLALQKIAADATQEGIVYLGPDSTQDADFSEARIWGDVEQKEAETEAEAEAGPA